MTPTSLLLNNKTYSYEQIRTGDYATNSVFEKTTLTFCQQWLNAQQEFAQQTSGSTGKPKTISITRAQMQLSAKLTVKALKLKPKSIALVCIDTAYIGGKMMLVRALEHQLQLVIKEPSSNPLKEMEQQFDFAAMVPLQFENTLKFYPNKIQNCSAIILGGAPVSQSLANQIAQLNIPVFSTYGMTETVSHIALKRLSQPKEKYFKIIGDTKIGINNQKQLVITGAITNKQKLITNDRVKLISSNQFEWLGRADNVINSGGIKIQLEEIERPIEHYFEKLNIKNRFFLYGIPDDYLGTKLILCIESENVINLISEMDFSLIEIDKRRHPKEIIYINSFVKTNAGKINRRSSFQNR